MSKLSPALAKITKRNKTPLMLTGGRDPARESMVLDNKRQKAYAMLLEEGKGIVTIAKEFGVSKGTMHGWLNHEYEKTKIANSHYAQLVREQSATQLDQIIERWLPLALSEDLKVEGDKYGANGELKHVEIEAWDAGTKATDRVLKAIEQKSRLFGLDKISVDLPKGTNLIFPTAIFEVVKKAAESMKENTIEGEFTHEN